MRRTRSTRLGVLVGIPIVITAALTALAGADEPPSAPPAAKTAEAGPGAKAGHVREVQQALRDAGYDPGPIDGIMGPRTRSALRRYIAVPPPKVPSPADRALAPLRGTEPRESR
jgi:Putative peptidoglycan binding domain